jgi:ABC-2 type transport system ATP-binding protein
MLETHELTKIFDGFLAVDRVSLRVGAGEVLAMLGPNGAGKTTTVRMMTSILAPTSGEARVAGFDVRRQPEQVRAHVGVLTEQHGLYERMKGLEYLDFFGEVYHLERQVRQKRAKELMERFGLADALNRRVGDYSKGMKQKLALVRALLHNPPVLLLDEPTSAMDPLSAKQVRDAIIELRRDERTFLITTHNLTEAQALADRIAIIRHGRIIASGRFEELARQFAGDTLYELRVNGAMNGAVEMIGRLVPVVEHGDDWVRYSATNPREVNPRLLHQVISSGLDVVSLAPITRTLEDIYLQVVKEDEPQETRHEPVR